jgi:hypothetical protein
MVRIIDCANGDAVTDREMTDDEFTKYKADQAARQTEKDADRDAKRARKTTRQAVMTRLNITADELKALLEQ